MTTSNELPGNAASGKPIRQTDTQHERGLRAWMKRHQTLVYFASGLLVVASYQFGQSAKQTALEEVPVTSQPVQAPSSQPTQLPAPTTPTSVPAGAQPWPQSESAGGSAPTLAPWPAEGNSPPSTRPWPGAEPANRPADPVARGDEPLSQRPESGQQTAGQQMAWFDDSGSRWDVALSPDGRLTGRIGNGQPYSMKGSINNNSMSYEILDGNGGVVAQATGTMQDPTHLAVKVSDTRGQVIYQGQLHINHPPSR